MLLVPILAIAVLFTPYSCTGGTYRVRSGSCKQCGDGLYQDQPDQVSCKTCSAPLTSRRRGSLTSFCTCVSATQYLTSAGVCEDCPSGMIVDKTYGTSCTCAVENAWAVPPVPPLYLTNAADWSDGCTACPSGMQTDDNDPTRCACNSGYITNAADWSAGCTACPTGMSEDSNDPTRCTCNSGYMTNAADWSAGCTACPSGMVPDDNDPTRCACPSSLQLTNAADWSEGCTPCPAGTKSNSGRRRSSSRSSGSALELPCLPCEKGRFKATADSSYCEKCPAKTYQDETGQVACKTCPAGKFTGQDRLGCATCYDPWQYFNSSADSTDTSGRGNDCIDCPWGQIVHAGDTECSGCALGTYMKEEPGIITTGMCMSFTYSERDCGSLCLDLFDRDSCINPEGDSEVLDVTLNAGPHGCIYYSDTKRVAHGKGREPDRARQVDPVQRECTPEFQCLCPSYCAAWSTCPAGQGMSTEGSSTSDRICAPCTAGVTYSELDDGSACQPVRSACDSATEYESTSPTASANRVCSAIGCTSPAATTEPESAVSLYLLARNVAPVGTCGTSPITACAPGLPSGC